MWQSSLLRYWNFQPDLSAASSSKTPLRKASTDTVTSARSDRTRDGRVSWRMKLFGKRSRRADSKASDAGRETMNGDARHEPRGKEKERLPPVKKIPVFFIDEAHKLSVLFLDSGMCLLNANEPWPHDRPALIRSVDAMKALLDAMLVLTKQDRLCHVIHATSDPFYQTWLRQLNVMQHCKVCTMPRIRRIIQLTFPSRSSPLAITQRGTQDAFSVRGSYLSSLSRSAMAWTLNASLKLSEESWHTGRILSRTTVSRIAVHTSVRHADTHFAVNANGKLDSAFHTHPRHSYSQMLNTFAVKQSSHFLQAHALLNLHIIHSAQSPPRPSGSGTEGAGEAAPDPDTHDGSQRAIHRLSPPPGSNNGFRIYSPLVNPHAAPSTFGATNGDGQDAPEFRADFTAIQLLKVMNRLAQPGARSLPYFLLCREMGVRAVDGMVRGRILDLRWTDPITKEGVDGRAVSMRLRDSTRIRDSARLRESMRVRESVRVQLAAGSSATAVNDYGDVVPSEEGEMVPMNEDELIRANERLMDNGPEEFEEDVVGPKLVPITPIMRYAMREVVQEYYDDDDQTVSEYASLSEVEEY